MPDTGRSRINEVLKIGHEIQQIQDLDVLLERILREARRFLSADAGSLYLKEGPKLKFSYTQNETLQSKLPPGKKMIYSTFSIPISNRSISGYVANTGSMLNIPDAYDLSPKAPYSFDRQFDEVSGYRTKSILTFPVKNTRGEILGVLQIINAKAADGTILPFSAEDEDLVMHFADNAAIAIERARMTRAIILRMIRMAEMRDPKETGAHVNRVAAYSVELYEEWARRKEIPLATIDHNKDILRMAAMLHDVGKIAIPDAILKKPARLDPPEIAVMQQHTFMGARLFTDNYSDFDDAAFIVALNHHEKWDGSGYPGHINHQTLQPLKGYEAGPMGNARGKRREEIPPFGRVVAIADVYDALGNRRSYKEAWDQGRVIDTLRADSGTHFDPEMIDAFLDSIEVMQSVTTRYPD